MNKMEIIMKLQACDQLEHAIGWIRPELERLLEEQKD